MIKLSRQRNALIGGLLGGVGGGQLVLELLNAYTNVHLDPREAALVAGGVSTGVLLAGRSLTYVLTNGVRGAWRRIMDGKSGAQPHDVGGAPGGVTITPSAVVALADAVAANVIRQLNAAVAAGPGDTTPAPIPLTADELDEHAAPPGPLPSTQP
jgi:hypothetical protein